MKVSTPQGPVDMNDPTSIRNHAHRVLIDASTASDGGAGARIQSAKALLEIAEQLEAKQQTKPAPVEHSPDELAAARERLMKARGT